MALAYKCDICKQYCDDVYTIHGVSEANTHKKIGGTGCVDCCEHCYDEIMRRIGDITKDDKKVNFINKALISEKLNFDEEPVKCPFCNGENKNAVIFKNEKEKEYFVYCRCCGIETKDSFPTKAKAIKAFADGETKKIKEL